MSPSSRRLVAVSVCLFILTLPVQAQDNWSFSGQFFGDVQTTLQTSSPTQSRTNAFQIRRVFFTADFPVGDTFDGRFRIESTGKNTLDGVRSAPFLKDAYLRWKNVFADGHHLVLGLSAPPMWQVSQRFWSYRALARTIQHRAGLAGPRDTGIALHGPLGSSGTTRYGVMIGNDAIGMGETNRAKHVYAEIDKDITPQMIGAAGLDYKPLPGGRALNGHVFLGWHNSKKRRIATEIFYTRTQTGGSDENITMFGTSLFGWQQISKNARVILRADRTRISDPDGASTTLFLLAGFSYLPEENVQIIPNIGYDDRNHFEQPEIVARMTLYALF